MRWEERQVTTVADLQMRYYGGTTELLHRILRSVVLHCLADVLHYAQLTLCFTYRLLHDVCCVVLYVIQVAKMLIHLSVQEPGDNCKLYLILC
jgi:hypothetical protein